MILLIPFDLLWFCNIILTSEGYAFKQAPGFLYGKLLIPGPTYKRNYTHYTTSEGRNNRSISTLTL